MSKILASGHVRVLGDDINTDYIVPSHRKKETIDPTVLRSFIFEDIHPGFYDSLVDHTILVAGTNFGCGSAMEVAVTVLQAAGVKAVIAKSFSRTFRRNALNNGLLLCEAEASQLGNDAMVRIVLVDGVVSIESQNFPPIPSKDLPAFMLEMLSHGGLTEYLGSKGGFV